MSAESVFSSLQGYLQFRTYETRGRQRARVGELFTLAFVIKNVAHEEQIERVQIRYRDPHIIIQPTEFATFPDGSRGQKVLHFAKTELMGGEDSQVIQQFIATGELGDIADEFSKERIANVWVVADAVPEHYFRISNRFSAEFEIEGIV